MFLNVVPAHANAMKLGLAKADKVIVLKSERRLVLFRNGTPLKSYRVALGRSPRGAKTRQGDGRTPEGVYVLDWRNRKSRFYRSIHVSYPGPADRDRARREGVSPGGDIMIHGLPNGRGAIGPDHTRWDWTDGCIAVTNAEIDEIWSLVDDGTPIEIRR
ncbi:MAG: L,D-transpeptidase family protein [Rhodospirillales bacterium]|nr:L,D-transpeptidase family protein [Rhodospirillales bacterium]